MPLSVLLDAMYCNWEWNTKFWVAELNIVVICCHFNMHERLVHSGTLLNNTPDMLQVWFLGSSTALSSLFSSCLPQLKFQLPT